MYTSDFEFTVKFCNITEVMKFIELLCEFLIFLGGVVDDSIWDMMLC
jgi:hypothetical protein